MLEATEGLEEKGGRTEGFRKQLKKDGLSESFKGYRGGGEEDDGKKKQSELRFLGTAGLDEKKQRKRK